MKGNVLLILILVTNYLFFIPGLARAVQELPHTERQYINDFRQKSGQKPNAYMVYFGYHLAKAKESYRLGNFDKTLASFPILRAKLKNLKERERMYEDLVLDYFEIDVLESLGRKDDANSLRHIFTKKEKEVRDRSAYEMKMLAIKMELGGIHRLRGNSGLTTKSNEETQKTLDHFFSSFESDKKTKAFYKYMMDMAATSDKISSGDFSEAEIGINTSESGFKNDLLDELQKKTKNESNSTENPFLILTDALKVSILIESGREEDAILKIDEVLSRQLFINKRSSHGCNNLQGLDSILRQKVQIDRAEHIYERLAIQKLEACGNYKKAIKETSHLINRYEESSKPKINRKAHLFNKMLADLLIKSNDYRAAKSALEKAIKYQKRVTGSGSVELIRSQIKLVWIDLISNHSKTRLDELESLIETLEGKVGKSHPFFLEAANRYIALLGKLRNYEALIRYVNKVEFGLYAFFEKEFHWKNESDERSRTALLGKYWQFVDLLFSLILRVDNSELERELMSKLLAWKNITLENSSTLTKQVENNNDKVIDSVERSLSGQVLLEYKKYRLYDFNKFEYGTEGYGVCVFTPSGKKNECVHLGDAKIVESAANIKNRRSSLQKLFMLLIEPISDKLKGHDVLVSPDGILNLMPISSFINTNGNYFIQDHLIRYFLAGRHVTRKLPKSTKKKDGYIGIGGIEYGAKGVYKPLPLTGPEVEEVRTYFEAHERPAITITEHKAGKKRVMSALEESRYLHIASHAKFSIPEDQFISNYSSLAQIALTGSNDDNANSIKGNEILKLNLTGLDLVALSACDTGKGKVTETDGIYGLLRSFYIGGSANTMVSLWLVEDREGYEFMTDFFSNILADSEKSYAESIRETQLNIIRRTPGVRNAENWARFVLFEHGGIIKPNETKGALAYKSTKNSNIQNTHIQSESDSRAHDRDLLILSIQKELKQRGYGIRVVDGIYGANTKTAIIEYERIHNLRVTGQPTHQLLAHLKSSESRRNDSRVQETKQSTTSKINKAKTDALDKIHTSKKEVLKKLDGLKQLFR